MPISTEQSRQLTTRVWDNTQTDKIYITEDKLINILKDFILDMNKNQSWLIPLGFIISILLTLTATEFKNSFLGISKDLWILIFSLILIVSVIWLLDSLNNRRKLRKKTCVEYIVNKIKNNVPL